MLGLPRGGVPVAFEVARALGAPLDVIVVRKLGVPFQPELGFGASGRAGCASSTTTWYGSRRLTYGEMAAVEERERAELIAPRPRFCAATALRADLAGRTAIVVDDGIATGGTARAACQVARAHGASRVVLAVPVGSPDTVEGAARGRRRGGLPARRRRTCRRSAPGTSISPRPPTQQVIELLRRRRARRRGRQGAERGVRSAGLDEEVAVDVGQVGWPGRLGLVPVGAGEWWCSCTAAAAAGTARVTGTWPTCSTSAGLGTLLFDLLTQEEG